MLSSAISSLDFSTFVKFLVTALLVAAAAVCLVRDTASRYLTLGRLGDDAGRRGPQEEAEAAGRVMALAFNGVCFVCSRPSTKKCSRCKAVRYCSVTCQSKDWNAGHKMKCSQAATTNDANLTSTSGCKRQTKGMEDPDNAGSLLPARGTSRIPKKPRKVLFPYEEFVELFNWNNPGLLPCGLLNCGNSCFANVVLQCLASTRPLVAYLLEGDHSKKCSRNDWCFLCELQTHVHRVRQSLHPFSPINILSRIPNIGGNLGYGKQEDAHEFMRFAIDTMQSVCLDEFGGERAIEPSSRETTLIHHIFGGYLQSQVICSKCNKISNRYENMMDLTVEIHGDAESLEECLNQFTIKEWLEGENMYKCDGCNGYVTAWKRLTVHQAPNILTIALKRFQSGRFGKLNKRVTFPETLDLGPYMSEAGDGSNIYGLYAVVVHVDMLNASFFGHYVCYTKDNKGNWYRIDDCKVMKVELEEVRSQRAYMLLYIRINVRPFSCRSFKMLNNDDKLSVSMEELPCPTTSCISIIEPFHVTYPGRQMPDRSVEHGIVVHRSQLDSATGKEDSVDVPIHGKPENMDLGAVSSSQNNSSSVAFNGLSLSTEVSVSRSKESDLGGGHTKHDLLVEGCTTSNSMQDSYDCDEMSSKHTDQMQLGHDRFNCRYLSVNGISHASASLTLSSKKHIVASSIPGQLPASVPPVDESVEKGITEPERICTDGLADDNVLLSPKESLLRSFRRPKPLFAPGFSDKAAGMNKNSLDNYKADWSPDHFGQPETADGEILTSEYSMKTSSLCNGFAHSFLGNGDGETDNSNLTDLEPYRNGARLLASCERPRQETY